MLLNNILYYRVKQKDKDGKYSYSQIVTVKANDDKNSITITPNPSKGDVWLTTSFTSAQKMKLSMFTADGKLLKLLSLDVPAGNSKQLLQLPSDFRGLIYIVTETGGNKKQFSLLKE